MQDIQLYLPGILLAYSAFLLAIASPGPNILAVIGTSMAVNRSSGMALAMGVAIGSFTWAILTAFGLSAILATYASALIAIKILGGLYLLWLAYKSFKSAASPHDIDAKELAGGRRTPIGYLKRGYIIQMTNPKAALSWIAIISLGLKPDAPIWVGASIVIGTFFLSVTIHLLYAIAFSTPVMVRLYGKARRVIQGVLGTFFAFAGLRLLTSRG
ncbi:LysE family translocator [Parasulfitobacter algicola]|uniref:LysE family translocator n=1 Tax=Parasulfitobacter algicola TaxID=2614809 RepID=A0ABX2ITH0_9RHOB|nr:LysE family translocator [Sulfitobacter algicola]NSX56194.1 LysE family translocator [Sulfitobacter algicola]